MAFQTSVLDQLTIPVAEAMRKLETLKVGLMGANSALLRITRVKSDELGDETLTVTSELVDNIMIQFPLSQVEVFGTVTNSQYSSNSVNIWDLLPVFAFVKYNQDYAGSACTVQNGDILVRIILDEFDNKIPMIFEVTRQFSQFVGRREIRRKLELTLLRGQGSLEADVQTVIDRYIADYGVPMLTSYSPTQGSSGVVTSLSFYFDEPLILTSAQAILIGPNTDPFIPMPYPYVWVDAGQSGLVYSYNLSGIAFPAGEYRVQVTSGVISHYNVSTTTTQDFTFTAV